MRLTTFITYTSLTPRRHLLHLPTTANISHHLLKQLTIQRPNYSSRIFPFTTMSTEPELPSREKLLSSNFPETVELASHILKTTLYSRPDLLISLAATSAGARGLFVALLTDDSIPLTSHPNAYTLISSLMHVGTDSYDICTHDHPRHVRELAVKNVVMPAAMVVQYNKNGESESAKGSQVTRDRAIELVKEWVKSEERERSVVHCVTVLDVINEMKLAVDSDEGTFKTFMRKWGYDQHQKKAMMDALCQIVDS